MEPIDLEVDVTVDLRQHQPPSSTSQNAPVGRRTVPSARNPSSILSPTQSLVTRTVTRFGQATTSQLRTLHYAGTPRGTAVRASRHLKALSERGFIRRLPYRLYGYGQGSGEYVYAPADSTARNPNLHTLDITGLFVALSEARAGSADLAFDAEPWAHTTYGGHKVTPDFYAQLCGMQFWGEIDRGSESPSIISAKMARYVRAYSSMDGGTFPQVLWIAHDAERVRTLKREADRKDVPGLFVCLQYQDAVSFMTRTEPAYNTNPARAEP